MLSRDISRRPRTSAELERTLELTLALGRLVERSNASDDVTYQRQLQARIEWTREQLQAARDDVERRLDSADARLQVVSPSYRRERSMREKLRRWSNRLSDRVTDWLVRR